MKKAAEAESDLDAAKASQAAIAERVKSIQQTVRQLQAIQACAREAEDLARRPGRSAAIGRWRRFHDGAWSDGLELFLAKGSDRASKSSAGRWHGIASAATGQRVARGDAWWDAADKAVATTSRGCSAAPSIGTPRPCRG